MSEADTSNFQSLSETTALNEATEVAQAKEKTSPQPMEEAERLEPTQKLLQRNRLLLDHVVQLEQALRGCQEELQLQQARSQSQETLLAQHREMLKVSEDQIERLFSELESSHQASQRQQVLIETLSNQLETSQERVAHLERECALIQQQYNEQSHRMLQAENTCQDLQNRLQRQQRQTLQFKAALEKCLDAPEGKYREPVESSPELQPQPASFSSPPEPQAPPVTAAKLGLNSIKIDASGMPQLRSPQLEPKDPSPAPVTESIELASASNEDPWQLGEPVESSTEIIAPPVKATEEESLPAPTLDNQNSVLSLAEGLEEDISPQLLADLTSVLELLDEPSENSPAIETEYSCDANLVLESDLELGELLTEDLESEIVDEVADSDEIVDESDLQLPEAESLADEAEDETLLPEAADLSTSNWPSPLVRPLRPAKKIKSLAAIELPTFPRLRRYSK
jgi:hypothetical protein